MTRRRWIADEIHGDTAVLTADHAAHLSRVLRAQIGQEFDISTGSAVRRGRITSISDDRVEFALGAELLNQHPAKVTLLLSIFKFDRMEWAIEKCTEIGVTRIIPLIAQRTDSHLASAASKRRERWQRIALQASEQSRRTSPPEISAPTKLKEVSSSTSALRIVLSESETAAQLRDVIADVFPGPTSANRNSSEGASSDNLPSNHGSSNPEITLAIGPEGGWTDDELKDFRSAGWISASLGPTILRAETAAMVAAAVTMSALQ